MLFSFTRWHPHGSLPLSFLYTIAELLSLFPSFSPSISDLTLPLLSPRHPPSPFLPLQQSEGYFYPGFHCSARAHTSPALQDALTLVRTVTQLASVQDGGGLCSWRLTRGKRDGGMTRKRRKGRRVEGEWLTPNAHAHTHTQCFGSASRNVAPRWVGCKWLWAGALSRKNKGTQVDKRQVLPLLPMICTANGFINIFVGGIIAVWMKLTVGKDIFCSPESKRSFKFRPTRFGELLDFWSRM